MLSPCPAIEIPSRYEPSRPGGKILRRATRRRYRRGAQHHSSESPEDAVSRFACRNSQTASKTGTEKISIARSLVTGRDVFGLEEEVHSPAVVCLCFRPLCQWHFGENFQIPNVNGSVGNPASNRAGRLFPSRWADSRESHSQACQISVFDSPRSCHWKCIL